MKKNILRGSFVLMIAIFLFSFAACGASDSKGYNATEPAAESSAADQYISDETMAEEAKVSGGGESDMAASGAGKGSFGAAPADANRKITFSASYTIETKTYDADYTKISKIVADAKGYIATETSTAYPYQTGETSPRSSELSLRIPASGYNSFLEALESVGETANKNKSSEDLTAEYYDTESRIKMLEMRRDRLEGYIKKSTKAEDIVKYEKEYSDVLLELDERQGNKRRLDQLVNYATVDVFLNEKITPETIGKDGEPLGNRTSDAFSMSVTGVSKFLQDAAVFIAGAVPVILLLAVILIIVWLIVRLVKRSRKKYFEAHPEKIKTRAPRPVPQNMYPQNAVAAHQPPAPPQDTNAQDVDPGDDKD